jgi:hypothetical protein
LDQSSLLIGNRFPDPPIALLPATLAEAGCAGRFLVVVHTRDEFVRWLHDSSPGLMGLQVHGLLGDPEVWALAAQGQGQTPIDVVLSDPASEFSSLYRLVDVRLVRPVGVTIPARPGFLKALRLAASLQLPVRLLPGQPDASALAELSEALHFYLRDARVEAPVEFFHSLLATFRGLGEGTLWAYLEQDPALVSRGQLAESGGELPHSVEAHLAGLLQSGGECASCRWQGVCAGYFKWPDPDYSCAGIQQLLAHLEAAADEITRDLAGQL